MKMETAKLARKFLEELDENSEKLAKLKRLYSNLKIRG